MFNGLAQVVTPMIGFLLIPFMIGEIGVVEYGLIGISHIFNIGGYIGILELGFQAAILRYIADFHEKGEFGKMRILVNSAGAILLGIGAVSILAASLFFAAILNGFNIPPEYHESFRGLLVVVFASYLFMFPNFVLLGVLEGLQRYDVLRLVQIAATLANAAGVVLLLSKGYDYYHVVYLSVGLALAQFLVNLAFVFRFLPFLRLGPKYFSVEILREIMGYTRFTFLSKMSGTLFFQMDRVLIGIFLGPVFMASFEVLMRLPQLMRRIISTGVSALVPVSSQLNAAGDIAKLRRLFLQGLNFNFFLAIPLVTASIFFAPDFLEVWLGPDFVHLGLLLQILLLWNLTIPTGIGMSMLIGMGRRLRSFNLITWCSTLLKLGCILLLIKEHELMAVVLGFQVPIVLFPFVIWLYLKEFSCPSGPSKEVLALAVCGIPPLVLFWTAREWIPVENFFLMLNGGIWVAVYWGCLYFFMLLPENRDIVKWLGGKILLKARRVGIS